MAAIALNEDMTSRLSAQAARQGKTWDAVALEALQEYLDDQEDIAMAQESLGEGGPNVSLEELKRELGL